MLLVRCEASGDEDPVPARGTTRTKIPWLFLSLVPYLRDRVRDFCSGFQPRRSGER
jgi:hypothetical protein